MKRLLCVVLLLLVLVVPPAGAAPVAAPDAPMACSGLFFSEYIEGSSNNKALEIFNGTTATVDLSTYTVELYSNGAATPGNTATLSGSLAAGDVYVIANSAANAAILTVADLTSTVTYFNGDDAVALKHNGTIIDVIGQIGFDPGTKWGTEPITTVEHTLRRKSTISTGDANGSNAFDPATEWDSYAQDTVDGLGAHTAACYSTGDVPPTVTSTTPANGATNVSVTTNLEVTFSEPVTITNIDSFFDIWCDGSGLHYPSSGNGSGTSYTIDPTDPLPVNDACHAKILAAEVEDQDVPLDHMAADYVWDFTTDTPPQVSSTTPANGAVNVAANANLSVTFSEPVTATDNWFQIVCNNSGTRNVVDTTVSTADNTTFTINPTSDFTAGESCSVTIYAAQVSDQDVPLANMAADYTTWNFTVVVPCSQPFFSEYVEGSSYNKALEIYNPAANAVNLTGYTVELYSNGAAARSKYVDLSGALAAGDVYVMAHGNAATDITDLADLLNSDVVNFNGDDAVALRYNGVLIDVIGKIGQDPGDYWGTNPTTKDFTLRRKDTISAGDDNGSDAFDPATEWDGYVIDSFDGLGWHVATCGGDAAPTVTSTSPTDGATGVATTANITVNFSEAVNVSGAWYAISCPTSGAHTAAVSGGPTSFTLDPNADFTDGETCTVTVYAAQVADQDAEDPPDTMAADRSFSFGVGGAVAPCSTIPLIQGAGNASTCQGHRANIQGCVTGVTATGFYFQDMTGDGDPATSDGIYAYYYSTWDNPSGLAAGTKVSVSGTVVEYYDTTEFAHKGADPLTVTKNGPCSVPTAVAVAPITDPAADPMAQYEAYEGMRVSMTFDGWVVGPTKRYTSRYTFGDPEIAFVDFGSSITDYSRVFERDYTGYRGINYLSGGLGFDLPNLDFGDGIQGANITGVLGYQFDKYTLLVDAAPTLTAAENADVASNEPALDETKAEFDVCFMNVENLFDNIDDGQGDWGDWAPGYPTSGSAAGLAAYNAKLDKVAAVIVTKVKSCMVFGLEEMEGKQGVYDALVAKVNALDASAHTWAGKYVESGDSRDISQGFLYRDDVTLVGGALTPVSGAPYTTWVADGVLNFVRVPASGRFQFFAGTIAQRDIYIYAVHFKSKGNSSSCTTPDCTDKRELEAKDLRDILAHHQGAGEYAIAGGDYNDTFGSTPIGFLDASASIVSLYYDLAERARYSYIFNGESEVLDHYYVTKNLIDAVGWSRAFSPVHVDADFPSAEHASDHDPLRARFRWMSDYSDLAAYGNAWHIGDGVLRLGAAWSDDSSFSAADASDDGLVGFVGLDSNWKDGGFVTVDVRGVGASGACVYGWIDWNQNNSFADTGEASSPVFTGADNSALQISWAGPSVFDGSGANRTYNLRLRVAPGACGSQALAAAAMSPDANLSPTGAAYGGEVEDLTLNFTPNALTLRAFAATAAAPAWPAVVGFGLLGAVLLIRRRR